MVFRKKTWLVMTFLTALVLTACNIGATPAPTIDVNAVYTAAAGTAIANFSQQMTETAMAASPTPPPTNTAQPLPTPLPTFPAGVVGVVPTSLAGTGTPAVFNTPGTFTTPVGTLAGSSCNNSAFIADVTVPDGTIMKPGQDFTKTWAIQNTGTCKWDDGYTLAFVQGDNMDGYNITLKKTSDFVAPGSSVNFSIKMTAHLAPGKYTGCWKMQDDKGFFFGTLLCYSIEVQK